VAFSSSVDPLKQRHGAELAAEAILEIEAQVEEVGLRLHEALFSLDERDEEFAKKELGITLLI